MLKNYSMFGAYNSEGVQRIECQSLGKTLSLPIYLLMWIEVLSGHIYEKEKQE